MVKHELKSIPEFFRALDNGRKQFEIRINDRNFQVGDILFLREYDPLKMAYTGRAMSRIIIYMSDFAQKRGIVVLGLNPMNLMDD